MTKRIFRSILIVASLILAACLVIVLGVLYDYFTAVSEAQMITQTSLIARAVENEGEAYFDGLEVGGYRITWIGANGEVLYDTQSDAAAMESHADREEFIEAAETGAGESSRYSATLTERMLYCAKRLSDGSVVRLASAQNTILTLVLGMLQPILIVLVLAIILSAVLASRLAKHIVKPMNELNLDEPLENDAYEELEPLLGRIERQHRQISAQMEELRGKQEEWDTVANSMNEGIVLLNEKKGIISINGSAMKLLSAESDCVGRDFLTICRSLDIQRLLSRAAGGEKSEIVVELNGLDYQVNASPVLSDGKVKATALLFFDVTEKARAEQMRREFTANVSHELKTPLHTISGTAEIMRNGIAAPEDMPRFIERIYTEAQRMIALVSDIIRLSGLDEGISVDQAFERLSLKTTAEDVKKRLAPQAEEKNITFDVSGDDGEISGIAPLITELVYNLCDNAIKYNCENGSVIIDIKETENEVILSAADTGIGIPAAAQERVFERFYRVDKSHSKEIGGTGLGLSIVKHVAKMHNAQLKLSSRLDEGTTVTLSFPKQN